MKVFRVFHAKAVVDENNMVSIKGRFGFDATTFPDDFRHVADVVAPALGAVFGLTNHINHAWPENEGVLVASGLNPLTLRSTSVGDIIQDGHTFYAVAPTGFVTLPPFNEWFAIPVPALYAIAN